MYRSRDTQCIYLLLNAPDCSPIQFPEPKAVGLWQRPVPSPRSLIGKFGTAIYKRSCYYIRLGIIHLKKSFRLDSLGRCSNHDISRLGFILDASLYFLPSSSNQSPRFASPHVRSCIQRPILCFFKAKFKSMVSRPPFARSPSQTVDRSWHNTIILSCVTFRY